MSTVLFLLTLAQLADPLSVVVDEMRPDHDVIHYHIAMSIPQQGTTVRGATTISYVVRGGAGPLVLDFDSVFAIDSVVTGRGVVLPGSVREGLLRIEEWSTVGDTLSVTVYYWGQPRDGLFIQPNVHGDRTAFADNWPNRAHHWFPSEDHPSDKATASFAIDVPADWRVVANGALERVDTIPDGRTRWHWRTERRIPVYTMVIGAGPMVVASLGTAGGASQQLWTFASDSAFAGTVPFRRVREMVETFSRIVGPFPYAKLAHVQSPTRFGGMENSSAIFYAEGRYADRSMGEGVVAHETAHQWFGDAVTAFDWHHLWLSEGFASYLAPVFFELAGERSTFRKDMEQKKARYLASSDVDRPVIDTAETDLFGLLNRNNYQKGAWILHMLRGMTGDSSFFGGLREYYALFRDSTVLTSDFVGVMQRHTDRPLRRFFEQWLLQPGYPQLDVSWTHDPRAGAIDLRLTQVQPAAWGVYELAVPIWMELPGGREIGRTVTFDGESRSATARVENVAARPLQVIIDRRGDLLLTVVALTERP